MKKKLLIVMMVQLLPVASFCGAVKVNVETAGTLQQVLSDQEETKVTDLTITGEINAVDIAYLRSGVGRIASLEVLDLKGVTLVASEEPYLTIKTSGSFSSGKGSETYYISDEEKCDSVQSASSGWILDDGPYYQVSFYGKNLAGAFQDMSLKRVVLPSCVKKIEYKTFGNCQNLETVEMPSDITEIGRSAFYGCESLMSIGISSSVTRIGDSAFYGCANLKNYDFSKISQIGSCAFAYCTSLIGDKNAQLDLSKIDVIPFATFSSCESLTSVKFSNELTSIGEYAFDGCNGLISIVLPEGLVSIGNRAFAECTELSSVSLPSTLEFVTYESFDNTAWLRNHTAENGIVYYGNIAVAYISYYDENDNLVYPTSLSFREGTIGIGDNFFKSDDQKQALTSVSFPSTLRHIGDYAFKNTKITKINLPEGLETIGEYAFWICSELDDFTLPSSLKTIGRYAFKDCKSLSKLTIPENVEELNQAFDGCLGIVCVNLYAKHLVKEEGAYNRIKGTLGYLGGLEKVVIGSQVEVLPYGFVSGNENIKIVFEERNPNSKLFVAGGLTLDKLTLPDCMIELDDAAFYGTNYPIEILGTVISLGYRTFCGCTGIKSLRLSDEITEIPEEAFNGCENLVSVNIPTSLTTIGSHAFSGCSSLTSITIPDGVISIGESAFRDCSGLTSITIPDGVTSIGSYAFVCCSGLTSVTIPGSATSIDERTFADCSGLTSVTIGNGVTSIGEGAFAECSGLTSITIPDGVTSIGWNAFVCCSGLTSITIPGSVISIGNNAFGSCSSLTSITIPNSVTSIENNTFYECRGLSSITIPNSVISIGEKAFYGCSNLTSITIPDGVISIGRNAFSYCEGLTSITVPNSVTFIDDYAFYYCSSLLDFYCYAEDMPWADSSIFKKSNYNNATLHVPEGSIEVYQTAEPWNQFMEIVAIIEGDANGDCEVDANDVAALVNMIAAGDASAAGDLNGDGKVDIADVVTLVNIIAGKKAE